jgi:hypothetical protein
MFASTTNLSLDDTVVSRNGVLSKKVSYGCLLHILILFKFFIFTFSEEWVSLQHIHVVNKIHYVF